MKRHIPNLITLANLFCGSLAVIFAVNGDFYETALLVVLGILFDFFDGFAARILNVQGELGKQLDSLADMVTSGVVPGVVMIKLIERALKLDSIGYFGSEDLSCTQNILPYLGLFLTLGAGYRLANFNIDTRQSDSFIGVPTPAMSLFVISLAIIVEFIPSSSSFVRIISNEYFLILITFLFTILMNAELPLFSLKFKNYSFKKNMIKYSFLILSLLLLVFFKIIGLPIIILLYIVMSVINNILYKKNGK